MAIEKKIQLCGPQPNIRKPSEVMKLERMGSFHPSRLSFARILIRKMIQQKTRISCTRWEMDGKVRFIENNEEVIGWIASSALRGSK